MKIPPSLVDFGWFDLEIYFDFFKGVYNSSDMETKAVGNKSEGKSQKIHPLSMKLEAKKETQLSIPIIELPSKPIPTQLKIEKHPPTYQQIQLEEEKAPEEEAPQERVKNILEHGITRKIKFLCYFLLLMSIIGNGST